MRDNTHSVPPHLRAFAVEVVRQQITGRASRDVIDIAIEAVVAGAESAALNQLANLDRCTDPAETTRLFASSASELELPLIGDDSGVHPLCVLTLRLIDERDLPATEGAQLLFEIRNAHPGRDDLDIFNVMVEFAGTHDFLAESGDELSRSIKTEAASVLLERAFIRDALSVWDGPASASSTFVQTLGFGTTVDFHSWRRTIIAAIDRHDGIRRSDWDRVVEGSRVAVLDDDNGAGWDWSSVAPYLAAESTTILSAIERRYGHQPGDE